MSIITILQQPTIMPFTITFEHECSNKCSCKDPSGSLSYHEQVELYTQGTINNIVANDGYFRDPHTYADSDYGEEELNYEQGFIGAECGISPSVRSKWTDEEKAEFQEFINGDDMVPCECQYNCGGYIMSENTIERLEQGIAAANTPCEECGLMGSDCECPTCDECGEMMMQDSNEPYCQACEGYENQQ